MKWGRVFDQTRVKGEEGAGSGVLGNTAPHPGTDQLEVKTIWITASLGSGGVRSRRC